MKRHPSEPTHTDPVCGMKLSRKSAAEELEHDGKTYYFCAEVCRKAFEANPEKYIHHHHQHGTRLSCMSRAIRMLIGCLLPLALIFVQPMFGVSSGITLLVFIGLMFMCHL